MVKRFMQTSLIVLVSIMVLQGCSLSLKNHTPAEFPYVGYRDTPASTLYINTYVKLESLSYYPAHRFLLEVKPKNVTNIRAYVVLDGVQHLMDGSGSGLWTYESPNQCQNQYSYRYFVRYRAGLYGNKVKTLGSPEEPLIVNVSAAGQESWFVPGESVRTGDGTITLYPYDAKDIVIQNLAPYPVRIIQLWFYNRPGELNDNNKFELLSLPTLPFDLSCGESITVRVHWKTEPPDYSDKGVIFVNMSKDPVGTGNYQQGFRAYIDVIGTFVP